MVKNLNQQHILNLVRLQKGITAREISTETGLQMATVLYTLRELKKTGFVREAGLGFSTWQGGKPPQTWEINSSFGYLFGIELLSTETRLILMDFAAGELHRELYYHAKYSETNEIIEHLAAIIAENIEKNNIEKNKILGIGVAIPGSVNHEHGFIEYSYTFDFKGFDFKQLLMDKIKLSVEIDNDANAGVLGIKWLIQEEQLTSNVIYLSINQNFSGMGVGFILNHDIYRGAHGAAGEMSLFAHNREWNNIIKKAEKRFDNKNINLNVRDGNRNVREIIKYARQENPNAIYILREFAKIISNKLAVLANLFDPDVIYIGGDICEARPYLEKTIKERFSKSIISDCVKNVPVKYSDMGTFSVASGAVALVLQKIFSLQN